MDYSSYEEDYSYDLSYSNDFPDNDQDIFNFLDDEQTVPTPTTTTPSPPPQISNNDDSIAFSSSINQSRKFLQEHYNIPISAFRTSGIPGLIILRLQDISSIRVDANRRIQIPHLLYSPTPNSEHPELIEILHLLHKP